MSLKLENLSVRRGDFHLELPSLEVAAGEIVVLMGPSGSGKSTLLDAISGFLPVEKGKISLNGVDITHLPPEKRKVALVFQRPALFSNFNVRDNVAFGLRIQKKSSAEIKEVTDRWLERLEILELAERAPSELSGGQAQRVALARAFVVGFPALLLDEPFSAMDVPLRSQLRRVVKELVKSTQTSCLMVSHDPDDAKEMGVSVKTLEAP